jgi:hypothetical protein
MSYLTTPELKSFQKAVISFWFRVPQASLDAAQKEYDDFYAGDNRDDPPPLLGLVPLVVFGKEGTSNTTAEPNNTVEALTTSTAVHTCVEQASDSFDGTTLTMTAWSECEDHTNVRIYYKDTITYSAIPGKPTNPSFIAIDGYGNLQINFESTQIGDVVLAYDITSSTSAYYTQETINECYTFSIVGYCGDYNNTVVNTGGFFGLLTLVFTLLGWRLATSVTNVYIDEGSSPRVEHPQQWIYGPIPGDMGTGAIKFTPGRLAADAWHHVLISVDMTGGSASTGYAVGGDPTFEAAVSRITKTSTLYVAIDDVNHPTGGYLFPGTNKVVTGGASTVAIMGQAIDYNAYPEFIGIGPVPSYSLDNMTVPAAEVGIPSVGTYVDKVRKVEMAEFMMFTGVTLDTSIEKNRRLFITAPDKNGAQFPVNQAPIIVPISKTAVGDAAAWEPGADTLAFVPGLYDPSGAPSSNQILGVADIDFTKCSFNWMMGRNLGTLKGKVVKTGKIKAYSSDPQLKSGS